MSDTDPEPHEPSPPDPAAKKPAKPAPPASKRVISRSFRVRELPPPPVVSEKNPPEEGLVASSPPPANPVDDEVYSPVVLDIDGLGISSEPGRRTNRRRANDLNPTARWVGSPQNRGVVGFVGSFLVHLILLLLLTLVARSLPGRQMTADVQASAGGEFNSAEEGLLIEQATGIQVDVAEIAIPEHPHPKTTATPTAPPKLIAAPPVVAAPAAPVQPPPTAVATVSKPKSSVVSQVPMAVPSKRAADLFHDSDVWLKEKLGRRNAKNRGEAARYGDATTKSEDAVESGLRWILAHQRPDGSWRFDHTTDLCMHYCTNPGSEASATAATGLALLPLLGAGYTHRTGEYQGAIGRALDYLKEHGVAISYGNDLRDGSMYGQALATIALCEAESMTEDPELRDSAQRALDFIVYCQDSKGGGWRYNPGEPGDTTVTGWMLMALRSGQMARLQVPTPALRLVEKFLDGVQSTDGAEYGYLTRKPRATTTAVGLLSRMYSGWQRENPGLVKGVARLKALGPSKDSMYFDYYATQVMFHYGGADFNAWNVKMREMLVAAQDHTGHQSGSWYFPSEQSAAGGRLYNTAMAILILEVYYRYLPLYSPKAVDGKM